MKTPEEIKKGLRNAKHVQCMGICDADGNNDTHYGVLVGYALRDQIYIYITELESRLAKVERERDAAVSDVSKSCLFCKHVSCSVDEQPCTDCFRTKNKIVFAPMTRTKFEWRGVCPENSKEESK